MDHSTVRGRPATHRRTATATRLPGSFDDEDDTNTDHAADHELAGHGADSSQVLSTGNSSEMTALMNDTVNEAEMHRQLMDMESSFLPAHSPSPSPLQSQMVQQADDSLVSGPASRSVSAAAPVSSSPVGTTRADESALSNDHDQSFSPIPYKTPLPGSLSEEEDKRTASGLDLSSPSAAAAARTVSRMTSAATLQSYVTADDGLGGRHFYDDDDDYEESGTESHDTAEEMGTPRTTRVGGQSIGQGQTTGQDQHPIDEDDQVTPPRKYLHRRQPSQKSVNSQHRLSSGDAAMGADYALQSGGAAPRDGVSALPEGQMSRSGSLGSLMSGVTLDEPSTDRQNSSSILSSDPATPRQQHDLRPPTDTVVAEHVRNIHVPQSIARQFRFQQDDKSPVKSKKSLTLKEQSSTIDRMVKENFDLKIKIHYLDDALNKRSEEGVKEMISENVELKAKLAGLQKEMRNLKRKIRDQEKSLAAARNQTSAPSVGESDSEEVVYLRERIERYELEIERMRAEGAAREAERRQMGDLLNSLSSRNGHAAGSQDELDMWKDLLEAETNRRELADEANRKLREEIRLLEQTGPVSHSAGFEQLRHENDELRREVGAQTSMLTSRNREKERLYQEIEELKMGLLRDAKSTAGDSILDRSASRAGEHGYGDDALSELRGVKVELEKQLESCLDELEQGDVDRADFERKLRLYEEEIEILTGDLQTLQDERDEAMNMREEMEGEFEDLKAEAQQELDLLVDDLQRVTDELSAVRGEKSNKDENFEALQAEMRAMSEEIVRLEDEQTTRASTLQQRLQETTLQLRTLEQNISEAHEKNQMMNVQQESLTGEIAFLREEQETDKMRIGDLQAALKTSQLNVQAEKELVTALEQRHAEERQQREAVGHQERQRMMEGLNREVFGAREEARRARKALSTREVEAKEWRDKLAELENAIREALGLTATDGLLKLRLDHDSATIEIRSLQHTIMEKDSLLKDRDMLLERSGMQAQQYSDALDKERQLRKSDRVQLDMLQRETQMSSKSALHHQAQLTELQNQRTTDKKRLATLEAQHRDQIAERNNLLFALWNRVSSLCGRDWTSRNGLVNGRPVSQELIAAQLPVFAKVLVHAVKTIENLMLNFKARVRQTERELWKEYEALQHSLNVKTKKLEKLESALQDNRGEWVHAEIARIGDARSVPSQGSRGSGLGLAAARQATHSDAGSAASSSAVTARSHMSHGRASTVNSGASVGVGTLSAANAQSSASGSNTANDQKWLMKLRELERKLKAEREERLLDRSGARKRLQEGEKEKEELRSALARERERRTVTES